MLYNDAMLCSNRLHLLINYLILCLVGFYFADGSCKKLLWYADVLAYTVRGSPLAAAPVGGVFIGLVSIKSSYALINELWFFLFAKSLSKMKCFVSPRLTAKVFRSNFSSADVCCLCL